MIHHNHQSGFTLLELLVAVGIFTIVMSIGVGSLITVIDASKKSRAYQETINNLNFALDEMTRNLRIGRDFYCGSNPNFGDGNTSDCTNGAESVTYTVVSEQAIADPGDRVAYFLSDGKIMKQIENNGDEMSLTSEDIDITNLTFYVEGSNPGISQPRARIVLDGVVRAGTRFETRVRLQSTATQRIRDLSN